MDDASTIKALQAKAKQAQADASKFLKDHNVPGKVNCQYLGKPMHSGEKQFEPCPSKWPEASKNTVNVCFRFQLSGDDLQVDVCSMLKHAKVRGVPLTVVEQHLRRLLMQKAALNAQRSVRTYARGKKLPTDIVCEYVGPLDSCTDALQKTSSVRFLYSWGEPSQQHPEEQSVENVLKAKLQVAEKNIRLLLDRDAADRDLPKAATVAAEKMNKAARDHGVPANFLCSYKPPQPSTGDGAAKAQGKAEQKFVWSWGKPGQEVEIPVRSDNVKSQGVPHEVPDAYLCELRLRKACAKVTEEVAVLLAAHCTSKYTCQLQGWKDGDTLHSFSNNFPRWILKTER